MPSKNQIKQYIREVRIAHDSRIADSLGGGVISGGGSAGVSALSTVPATVDGGFWYEVTNNVPMIWLREGNYAYGFNYDTLKFVGETSDALAAYLPFDGSATADAGGNEWTATGDVSLSTEIKKFGTSSVHLPSGAYISAKNILDIHAEKWTFDAWLYLVNTSGSSLGIVGLGHSSPGTSGIILMGDQTCITNASSGDWQFWHTQTKMFSTANQWVHIAIVRDGSVFRFFKNGILYATHTLTEEPYSGDDFTLGGKPWNTNGDMYFDNVRFFEGVALWNSDFTPPTAADYE